MRTSWSSASAATLFLLLTAACTDAPLQLAAEPETPPVAADRRGAIGDVVVVAPAGLVAPESIVHDPVTDLYLVSNLGDPFSAALDGFISRLYPDGTIETLNWITGLISPSGIAIDGRTLYVVDRAAVHTYDLDTGAPLSVVPFPAGVVFLNDICGGPDGRYYVTDTGILPTPDGFVSVGTDAIYEVRDGAVSVFASGPALRQPNGCLRLGAKHVGFTSYSEPGGVFSVNASGQVKRLVDMPAGAGLNDSAILVRNRWIISSWGAAPFDISDGDGVRFASRDGAQVPLMVPFPSPGDIGYDATRDRALVPSVLGNILAFVTLR